MPKRNKRNPVIEQLPRACVGEREAVELLEKLRWGDSPACPRCGDTNVYQIRVRGSEERSNRYLWRCRGCARQYTVRTNTVFEDSKIPLKHWCWAFWAACSHKKGVAALTIHRETGVSHKSALFMLHRIRYAMAPNGTQPPLRGTVEVDETYVGGKPRHRQPDDFGREGRSKMGPAPDFQRRKTPVIALIERDGTAYADVAPTVTGKNLKESVFNYVDPSARIMTDEHKGYQGLDKRFAGGHHTVNHSKKEYARGDVHVNTAESFFAILKRGIYGTYHAVSRKHLHRYLAEFTFRWNTRKLEDAERVVLAVQGAENKRLRYKEPRS